MPITTHTPIQKNYANIGDIINDSDNVDNIDNNIDTKSEINSKSNDKNENEIIELPIYKSVMYDKKNSLLDCEYDTNIEQLQSVESIKKPQPSTKCTHKGLNNTWARLLFKPTVQIIYK